MAFAVASRGASSAGLLKNLRRLAAPSSSLLARASSVAATRCLLHRNYYYYAAPYVGNQVVSYDHQPLAPHYSPPMLFFNPAAPAHIQSVSSMEVGDAVKLTVAMPGLPKERVKVWTNRKDLFVGVKGTHDAVVHGPAPYSCYIEFCPVQFDLGKAKAELEHGLLNITVPRIKEIEIMIE